MRCRRVHRVVDLRVPALLAFPAEGDDHEKPGGGDGGIRGVPSGEGTGIRGGVDAL